MIYVTPLFSADCFAVLLETLLPKSQYDLIFIISQVFSLLYTPPHEYVKLDDL